ncbi:Uncharacterised protein [uncultured Blautia sp.]
MKKKTVKMVLAVVSLAVLCGVYLGVSTYVSKQEEAENSKEEEEQVSVTDASADEIETVKFLIDKKEVTFQRKEEEWVKGNDEAFPVSQDTLNNAVGMLGDLKAERVLDDVSDLSEYGLDSPVNTIVFKTKVGEETSIKIGVKNESVSQYYVKKNEDDKKVYLVASASIEPFMNSLYDYAESGTFPEISSENIKAIQVEGETSYNLSVDENGFWYVSDGGNQEKADSAKAASMASSFSTLEYASFVNYDASEEEMESYGLNKPYANVILNYEEEVSKKETDNLKSEETELEEAENTEEKQGEKKGEETGEKKEEEAEMEDKSLVIHVGSEAEEGDRYVSVDDSKEVYTMSEETLSTFLDKDDSDFWDMNVCYTSINDIESVEITYKGERKTINVSRETSKDEDGNETETISYEMDGKELDSINMNTFYNKVSNMTAQKRVSDDTTLNSEPEMKIVLRKTDGTEEEVSYHSYDSNFYGVKAENKIYMVNKMNIKEMFEAYEQVEGENNEEVSRTEE